MRKNGLRARVVLCLAVGGAFAAPGWANAVDADAQLQRAQSLIRGQAFGLAAALLETNAPKLRSGAPSELWLRWTRRLWEVYRLQGRWQKLYAHAQVPSDFPAEIRAEAELQRIDALLKSQRTAAARELIRRQLPLVSAPLHKRRLRQKLIAAYLADDLLTESQLALQKFNQEYRATDAEWLLLSAGVLVRTEEYAAAINLLAPLQQAEARLLRLYARLGDASMTPAQVRDRARKLQKTAAAQKFMRALHAVLITAHLQAKNMEAYAEELELYLAAPASDFNAQGIYPSFTPQDLRDAYAKIAEARGNAENLLRGDDAAWLQYASELAPEKALTRKAIFAYVIAHATGTKARRRAMNQYVDELLTARRSALIPMLFGTEKALGALTLSSDMGLRVVQRALVRGDYALAVTANESLGRLANAAERTAWILRGARIDIFAGRTESGAEKLQQWLDVVAAKASLTSKQTDVVLQPIFDLQTVHRHDLALPLLHTVLQRAATGKQRREIAYWLADSYFGAAQYRQAAEWFLHSAMQHENGFDPWGIAAQRRAARALVAAALFDDAKQIYQAMLRLAEAPEQRQELHENLLQIAFQQGSHHAEAAEAEGSADAANQTQ